MRRALLALALTGCASQWDIVALPPDAPEPAEEVTDTFAPPEASTEPEAPPADAPVDDPPPPEDCDHTSDLVYVIGRDDQTLYLFDPPTLTMTPIGRLRCGTSASPGSMAVARDGFAYVRYSDETVKQVDLTTMACRDTAYTNQRTSFGAFGMGFSSDVAGGWRETLYVADFFDVATLDTQSWRLDRFGSVASQAELTGTADGELWGFFPLETPAELAQIDKTSGRRLRTMRLPTFPEPAQIDAFAFAGWGGSFWLFVREYGVGRSTDIYRVDPGPSLVRVARDIGFDVVGAGVSTCAPAH
jgi:hypothetical protein